MKDVTVRWVQTIGTTALFGTLLATSTGCGAIAAAANPKVAWAISDPAPMSVVVRRADVAEKTAQQVDRHMIVADDARCAAEEGNPDHQVALRFLGPDQRPVDAVAEEDGQGIRKYRAQQQHPGDAPGNLHQPLANRVRHPLAPRPPAHGFPPNSCEPAHVGRIVRSVRAMSLPAQSATCPMLDTTWAMI